MAQISIRFSQHLSFWQVLFCCPNPMCSFVQKVENKKLLKNGSKNSVLVGYQLRGGVLKLFLSRIKTPFPSAIT